MILKTERLELVPLFPYQLRLWVEDIPSLEKNLRCSYQAEPMEGPFLEIVKGQLEKTKIYRTFKVVIGIEKDNPECYIMEQLSHTLGCARGDRQMGISREKVAKLLESEEG